MELKLVTNVAIIIEKYCQMTNTGMLKKTHHTIQLYGT